MAAGMSDFARDYLRRNYLFISTFHRKLDRMFRGFLGIYVMNITPVFAIMDRRNALVYPDYEAIIWK